MSRLQKPIIVTAGEAKVLTFTVYDNQGQAVKDLTGYTGTFKVSNKITPSTAILLPVMELVDATAGKIKVTLSSASTTTLSEGAFTCQIVLNDGTNDAVVIDQPSLIVRKLISGFGTPPTPEVGYWKLAETSAGAVVDSSGNELDGTNSGATINQSGPSANIIAYSFDGVNDKITVPKNNLLNVTTEITVGAWVYLDNASANFPTILGKKSNFEEQYVLGFNGTTRKVALRADNINTDWANDADTALDLNTWTHVMATYEGTTIRYYCNGLADGTYATTGVFKSSGFTQEPDLLIGEFFSGFFFSGKMARVVLSNRAWTAAEVLAEAKKDL